MNRDILRLLLIILLLRVGLQRWSFLGFSLYIDYNSNNNKDHNHYENHYDRETEETECFTSCLYIL